jgi:hypothetical protein
MIVFVLGLPGYGKSVATESIYAKLENTLSDDLYLLEAIKDQLFQLKATRDHRKQVAFLEMLHFISGSFDKNGLIKEEIQKIKKEERECLRYINRLITYISHLLLIVAFYIVLVKKLLQRFLAIALQILNRISRSPTPQKKEPVIGGVKVGGKHPGNHRHVAGTLYLKQTIELAA